MSEPKKKCLRQYSVDYLKFGFVPSPSNKSLPMCLICSKTLSNEAMKPSRLQDHLIKIHPDKKSKDVFYFQGLKDRLHKQPTVSNLLNNATEKNYDGLRASYNISKLIAKSGKPHTIAEELILPAVNEVISTVMHKPASEILRKIPLSNNSVQRRIDEMAADVEEILYGLLRKTKFSLQLDESTLPGKEALLLAYVRFKNGGKLIQELLFAECLETDTKGETIFNTVDQFFTEKVIPLENISSVATDGAPAMNGRYRGFIAFLKKKVPNVLAIHCVIHRQHLVAKNLNSHLHDSLQHVINAVNKIKSSALSSRIFEKLCEDNDEKFSRLLLHTEVRWLSKGSCLNRFIQLFDTVVEFYEKKDSVLAKNLNDVECDIAYLADIFGKFNEVNLQLQGDNLNLVKTKTVITAFIKKLPVFKLNVGRREFVQFPHLMLRQEKVTDDEVREYCAHLEALHRDFIERFDDILKLDIPSWLLDPFANVEFLEDIQLQEELIELTANEELKPAYKRGYQDFWLQASIENQYPKLWKVVEKLLVSFPSSYLVEKGFSAVMNLVTKKRNRFQVADRGDLRLMLTELEPDVDKLVKCHQIHPSH